MPWHGLAASTSKSSGRREQRNDPRRSQPGRQSHHQPEALPRPPLDLFERCIETAGGKSADGVQQNSQQGVGSHVGAPKRETALSGARSNPLILDDRLPLRHQNFPLFCGIRPQWRFAEIRAYRHLAAARAERRNPRRNRGFRRCRPFLRSSGSEDAWTPAQQVSDGEDTCGASLHRIILVRE